MPKISDFLCTRKYNDRTTTGMSGTRHRFSSQPAAAFKEIASKPAEPWAPPVPSPTSTPTPAPVEVKKEKKEKRKRKRKASPVDPDAPVKPKRAAPPALKEWREYMATWKQTHKERLVGMTFGEKARLCGISYRHGKSKKRADDPDKPELL